MDLDAQYLFFITRDDDSYYFNDDFGTSSLIEAPCIEPDDGFSSGFPEKLITRAILTTISLEKRLGYPNHHATVLDPFCGSATTGIVALRYACKFIGTEKEAWAFPKIEQRLDKRQRAIA